MDWEKLETSNWLSVIEVVWIHEMLSKILKWDEFNKHRKSLQRCISWYSIDESKGFSELYSDNFQDWMEKVFQIPTDLSDMWEWNFDYTVSLENWFLVFAENNSWKSITRTVVGIRAKDIVDILAHWDETKYPAWIRWDILDNTRFNSLLFHPQSISKYGATDELWYRTFIHKLKRDYTSRVYDDSTNYSNIFVNQVLQERRNLGIQGKIEAISIKDNKVVIWWEEYSFWFSRWEIILSQDEKKYFKKQDID